MRLFYASGRLVYNFGFEDFTSFLVPQLRLTRHGFQSRNYGSEKSPTIMAYHGIKLLSDIPILQSAIILGRGNLMSLPSSNLSQSRLTVISPILHPWLPIVGKKGYVASSAGHKNSRVPFHVSHHQLALLTHCIVHSSHCSLIALSAQLFFTQKNLLPLHTFQLVYKKSLSQACFIFYFFSLII